MNLLAIFVFLKLALASNLPNYGTMSTPSETADLESIPLDTSEPPYSEDDNILPMTRPSSPDTLWIAFKQIPTFIGLAASIAFIYFCFQRIAIVGYDCWENGVFVEHCPAAVDDLQPFFFSFAAVIFADMISSPFRKNMDVLYGAKIAFDLTALVGVLPLTDNGHAWFIYLLLMVIFEGVCRVFFLLGEARSAQTELALNPKMK